MIGRAFLELVRLRRNQWLDTVELERIQFAKLRKLLKHAYENVPYYHRLFDSVEVKPDDIASLDDFQRIPITTKEQLQSLPIDQIVTRGANIARCLERRTSGSTGMPLTVYVTPEEKLRQTLVSLRILLENGLRFNDRLAYISDPHHFVAQNRWFQRLGFLRRSNVSVLDSPEEQIQAILKTGSNVLYGRPSTLALLAKAARASQSGRIKPRLVFTSAELLSPDRRQFLDSVFEVATCDVYGTLEFGDIAWQCERREGYHINSDSVVVELVKNGRRVRPGEVGELICTGLDTFTMPLIRYRVGDICAFATEQCSCGRGLPLLKIIEGRSDEFISLPDGKLISPLALTCVIKRVAGIGQFKVIQEVEGTLRVQIVKDETFSPDTLSQLGAKLAEISGGSLQVMIEVVDEIPRSGASKMRSIISKVTPRF